MCPDRGLNPRPFGLWDNAQATEPHLPGQECETLDNLDLDNLPFISRLLFTCLGIWAAKDNSYKGFGE